MTSAKGMRARWQRVRKGGLVLAALLTAPFASGCSLVNDTSELQCVENADCIERFGDIAYSCIENFCARPLCTADEQCKARGPEYAESSCGASGLCTNTSAASNPLACTTVDQCPKGSPTMMCVDGMCQDKVWGCVGMRDDRPAAVQPTATFKAEFIDGVKRVPLSGLNVTACSLPTFDLDCMTPLPGTSGSYDSTSGILTVTGVPQGAQFRLKVEPPADSGLFAVDFYSSKPPLDVTTYPRKATISSATAGQILSILNPPRTVDPGAAFVILNLYDCEGNPAAGAQIELADADKLPTTELVGLNQSGLPVRSMITDNNGAVYIANATSGRPFLTEAFINELRVGEATIYALAGRMTIVEMHPRRYR